MADVLAWVRTAWCSGNLHTASQGLPWLVRFPPPAATLWEPYYKMKTTIAREQGAMADSQWGGDLLSPEYHPWPHLHMLIAQHWVLCKRRRLVRSYDRSNVWLSVWDWKREGRDLFLSPVRLMQWIFNQSKPLGPSGWPRPKSMMPRLRSLPRKAAQVCEWVQNHRDSLTW